MESVALLPCVKAINLANNNITDDYSSEILSIFDNKAITHVDLSQNLMKKLGMEIGKKLKDECQHVMWIDLTQNDFTLDTPTVNMIINGLKKQKDLIYIGLSAQDQSLDQLVKIVAPKKPAMGLNIRNSRLTKHSTDYLCRQIANSETLLTSVSLKYCFL